VTAPATQADLGDRLRAARQHAGLSQQSVADCTGIPRTAISDIEHGQRKVDSLELLDLATLYGQDVTHFLGDAPRTPSAPETLAARLETVTTNLQAYIEQRAREVAEPHIAVAEEAADRRVAEIERQLERANDLVEELRRQLRPLLAQAEAKRAAGGVR
jgi:transcriptional regulator with XRE-family HTH domain